MQRQFRLEEISFENYNEISVKCDREPDPCKFSRKSGSKRYCPVSKRYFRILNHVVYDDISSLLEGAKNDDRFLRLVWVPGDMPISKAKISTQLASEDYFSELVKRKWNSERVVIEYLKKIEDRSEHEYFNDQFTFRMESGLLVLRYFHIRNANFEDYEFDIVFGNSILEKVPAISGVYEFGLE